MEMGCTPEQRAMCPLTTHFEDVHHLSYPRKDHVRQIDKTWRNAPFNKVTLCRWVHDAIHSSDYTPEIPPRTEMAEELQLFDAQHPPMRAVIERKYQLMIAEQRMGGR